jgi:hypothetical protein
MVDTGIGGGVRFGSEGMVILTVESMEYQTVEEG